MEDIGERRGSLMTFVRYVAALAVMVPVLVLAWTLGCLVRLVGALSGVVARWAESFTGLDGAG